jgi:hypothetical protein
MRITLRPMLAALRPATPSRPSAPPAPPTPAGLPEALIRKRRGPNRSARLHQSAIFRAFGPKLIRLRRTAYRASIVHHLGGLLPWHPAVVHDSNVLPPAAERQASGTLQRSLAGTRCDLKADSKSAFAAGRYALPPRRLGNPRPATGILPATHPAVRRP